ncbi:hypothetical protein C8F01DRAFT_1338753 [Mycena amicta]|nr:hypothetical protein C8F01DRAFT_1338753 [Mycena amicta]
MQARYGNSTGDPKPETWPKQLTFALAEKPFMTLPEIVNRYKPALCPFSANPNSNLSHNDRPFKSLLAMLITQKTTFVQQFTVSWILPGASHPTVNALMYPFKDIGLVGTFFPSTGVPDFPQLQPQDVAGPSSVPPPQPSIPVPPPMTQAQAIQFRNQIQSFLTQQGMPLPAPVVSQFITPPIISSLLKMTKENRSKALIQLAQRWQQQQQHQRLGLGLGLGLGVPAGGRLQGQPQMMADPQQPSEALGFNQFGGPMSGGFMSSGGYPDTMTQAGNNGAVSFQMMQNFMQRNQDGGSGGM